MTGVRKLIRAAVTGDVTGETAPNSHHAVHWGTVLACLLGVTWLVHMLEATPLVMGYRYGMFQVLSRLGPTRYSMDDVAVILVDDETYWKGEPAGRVPMDRNFLAKLVRRVAAAEPRLIALDFDLRSPDPQGTTRSKMTPDKDPDAAAEPADVEIELPVPQPQLAESVELFRTVDEVAATSAFVLPCTVKHSHEGYSEVADAHDGYPFASDRVARGYIQLAGDRRVIPPVLEMNNGDFVDSLATATTRSVAPEKLETEAGPETEHARYASFVPRDRIPTVTTSELLEDSPEAVARVRALLDDKIVLIGADWHSRALGEGPLIDSHPSPVGLLPGVMLHANYVESLLQGQYVSPAGMRAATLAEWLLTALIAYILFAKLSWKTKLAWLAGIAALYPVLSFFGMRTLGVYTDVLLLTLALALHLVADVPARLIHATLRIKELEARLAGRGGHEH